MHLSVGKLADKYFRDIILINMLTKRVFIAIPLPISVTQSLSQIQHHFQSVRSIRWAKPAHMHLTIQFLGDTSQSTIAAMTAGLNQTGADHSPFELQVAGLGAFPNLKRPRIIWAGLSGDLKTLHKLHKAITQVTSEFGVTPEARPFTPHITLGRVKKRVTTSDYRHISQAVGQAQQTVGHIANLSVEQIHLIQSQLQRGGPIYTPLLNILLQKPGRNSLSGLRGPATNRGNHH